jgi:DNA-binding transcriptional regulator/RsmH inhibitor MraZ
MSAPNTIQGRIMPFSSCLKRLFLLGFAALLLAGCGDKGEMVISPRFEDAGDFAANGLARVRVGDKWGYINEKGEEVISPRFDNASFPSMHPGDFAANGLARIWVKDGDRYGYIDEKGEFVIPPRFRGAGNFAANGLTRAKDNGKWGYINASGAFVISPRFDDMFISFSPGDFAANGLARVLAKDGAGYIDASGRFVIPPRFVPAGDFANGLAMAGMDKKVGYIDEKGEFVISPRFTSSNAGDFAANGLAALAVDGKWGYINRQGEFAIPPSLRAAGPFAANGLARAKAMAPYPRGVPEHVDVLNPGYGWGYINEKGEFVIPANFFKARDFAANGLAAVATNNGKWGYYRAPAKYRKAR